jgi:Glycosyl transferase family 2
MAPMGLPTWGIVVQVKAPLAAVETFVAWHLELGAVWIAIYFDDPDDPAAKAMEGVEKIKVFRCHDKHWTKVKGFRPELKTVRQVYNARHAYGRAKVDWLAHIDIDEFLWPIRPPGDTGPWNEVMGRLLAVVSSPKAYLRLRPHEALVNPDGSQPTHFRAPLQGEARGATLRGLFGPYAVAMNNGLLSHSVGKAISRTGLPGFQPRLHIPRVQGEKLPGIPFSDEIALLHYHAHDRDDWLSHVEYRARLGAYSGRDESRSFYQSASRDELIAFYDAVQLAHPEMVAKLAAAGMLLTIDPRLQEARARVFGGGTAAATEPAVTSR